MLNASERYKLPRDIIARIWVFQREIDDRLDITRLVPSIISRPLEQMCIDLLDLQKDPYSVGELDLAADARARILQTFEDIRGEDVTADRPDVRGSFFDPGLLDDILDPVERRAYLSTTDDPVTPDLLLGDRLDRNYGTLFLPVEVDELLCAGNAVPDDIVPEKHREGLVPDMLLGAQDCIPKSSGLLLSDVVDIDQGGYLLNRPQRLELPVVSQVHLKLWRVVEVVLDRPFPPACDDDQVLYPRVDRLLHHILYHRAVDEREHLLGHRLGRREEPGPKARRRDAGLPYLLHQQTPS